MTRSFRNIILLLSPFLLMVVVNETVRPTIKENPYSLFGITAINTARVLPDKCSWNCQNDTRYCEEHHVGWLRPFLPFTDRLYYGAIDMLKNSGNYALTNILFLVILFPGLIWLFITRGWNIQDQ